MCPDLAEPTGFANFRFVREFRVCRQVLVRFVEARVRGASVASEAHSIPSFGYVWVCLRVFGSLTSFGFVGKFWFWFVLAWFNEKNEVFSSFDSEDVIRANFHGHIFNH